MLNCMEPAGTSGYDRRKQGGGMNEFVIAMSLLIVVLSYKFGRWTMYEDIRRGKR